MVWKSAQISIKVSLLCLLATAVFSSCLRVHPQRAPLTQTGLASWYGAENHGLPTACREVYDMDDMTAAHKTLPFNTIVRVINLNNLKTVVVRINDRGPFVEGRIIDLSRAAARALEMMEVGVAPVKIEILNRKTAEELKVDYAVQAGSFVELAHAQQLVRNLKKSFDSISLSCFETPGKKYYRVRIRSGSYEEAVKTCSRLKLEGYSPYIVEI
jgi:rare lipoprotein A